MQSQRVSAVRAAYDCFNAKDVDGVLDLCDPDIEIPDVLHDSVRKGREEVERYWRHEFAVVDHTVALGEIVEMGDTVVAVVRHQMYQSDGRTPLGDPVTAVHRFTFRGDRIVKMEYSGLDEVPEAVRQKLG